MSRLAPILASLDEAAADLRAQIAALSDELAIVVTARAALSPATPEPAVKAAPVAPVKAAAPKRAANHGKRGKSIDYQPIAAWINGAKANGTYSLEALAKAFDADVSRAKNWPGVCRSMGLLGVPAAPPVAVVAAPAPAPAPVTDGPQPSALAKHAKVLACTEGECDFECETHRVADLNRHCLQAHGRRPHTHERSPVPTLGGAA